MTPADIAAWVGAAAWLPQITSWLYRLFVKPIVTIVPATEAEVGFTRLGPIFNVRMAFSCDRKDAIIDGIELDFTHGDGEKRTFRWAGLAETFSEISDEAGNRSVVKRDESPIALKIGTQSLVEKFVRFQEPRFHETERQPSLNLLTHFNFLKQSGDGEWIAKVLASKGYHALGELKRKYFWWKPGEYQLLIRLSSPKKIALSHARFAFQLSELDVDHLRQNVQSIETDLSNLINSNLAEPPPRVDVNWNWANVTLRRAAG